MTAISLLAACGGSTFNVQNHGRPPQQPVSVGVTTSPQPGSGMPVQISVNSTATVTATVTNNVDNLGVEWELLQCQSDGTNCAAAPCASTSTLANKACGWLSNSSGFTLSSTSGQTLTYNPPATIVGNTFMVEILAFALADESKQGSAQIQTTAFGNVLEGIYVFQAQGNDPAGLPYQIAGVIALDGNGNITSGHQTLNTQAQGSFSADSTLPNPANQSAACSQNPVPASCNYFYGSTYFVGSDGRGTIILNNMTDENGSLASEFFSLVVLSSSKGVIAHVGNLFTNVQGKLAPVAYSASGTLEKQTGAALPTGGYAFVASGIDSGTNPMDVGAFSSQPVPTALGGVFNIDNNPSPGDISGAGSLADQDYYSFNANTQVAHPQLESCVSSPPGLTGNVQSLAASSLPGVVAINLTGATCFSTQKNNAENPTPASIAFTGYVVDAYHMRVIESDVGESGSGSYNANGFLTSGVAVSQISPTTGTTLAGTFTDASLSGPYVLDALGLDFTNQTLTPTSFTHVSEITADGAGIFTGGIADSFFLNAQSGLTGALLITKNNASTYSVDSNGLGRAELTLKFVGSPAPKPNLLLYLTGDANPLVLYAGGEDSNFPAVGTGIAYRQPSNAQSLPFSGNYGVAFAQHSGSGEDDGSGQMTATPPTSPSTTGTLTGTADDLSNNVFAGELIALSGPLPLADTFTCGTGTCADPFGLISGTFMSSGPGNGPYVDYYLIDATQGLFVETDLINQGSGQVTLGYFAVACDVTSATSCQQGADSSRKGAFRKRASRTTCTNSYRPEARKGGGF